MQRNAFITIFVSVVFLSGCGKTLDFRNAEISNGTIYERGANSGFSGKVTNIPYTRLPAAPVGTVIKLITTVAMDQSISELVIGNAVAAMVGGGAGGLLCDVKVSDGALNGDTFCKAGGVKEPIFNMGFKDNKVDGKVLIHSIKEEGVKLAEANFSAGQLHGDLKIYSADGKVVIDNANFKNGLVDGKEEIRSPVTGKIIREINYTDGKQAGKEKYWSRDGKLLTELDWKEEKQTGFQKIFDDTGKRLITDLTWQNGKSSGFTTVGYSTNAYSYDDYHLKDGVYEGEHRQYLTIPEKSNVLYVAKVDHYVAGKVQGKVINYAPDGTISSTENYHDGQWVSTDSSGPLPDGIVATKSCLDKKIDAYRKEVGDDAMVRADMLEEWEGLCKAG